MRGSLEPRFSVPDFVSQLWRKIQSCETKSGTESLGSRLHERLAPSSPQERFRVRLPSLCCFHFQTQTKHLAPGKYDLGSFTKDLNSECWTMNIIIMVGNECR